MLKPRLKEILKGLLFFCLAIIYLYIYSRVIGPKISDEITTLSPEIRAVAKVLGNLPMLILFAVSLNFFKTNEVDSLARRKRNQKGNKNKLDALVACICLLAMFDYLFLYGNFIQPNLAILFESLSLPLATLLGIAAIFPVLTIAGVATYFFRRIERRENEKQEQ